MTWWHEIARQKRSNVAVLIGFLLLLFFLQSCGTQARVILPAKEAEVPELLPDGRHISHGKEGWAMILDVATGEDIPVPGVGGMTWIGDNLFYGETYHRETDTRTYYVINLQPLSVVELATLAEKNLSAAIQSADSIYDLGTEGGTHRLLLLNSDSSGQVVQGYQVTGVSDLDELLAGRTCKKKAAPIRCSKKEISPDGQYYYQYISAAKVEVYSQQGKLVNSFSAFQLQCYGWAWDSSGVYIQSRERDRRTNLLGPLLLLEVNR